MNYDPQLQNFAKPPIWRIVDDRDQTMANGQERMGRAGNNHLDQQEGH